MLAAKNDLRLLHIFPLDAIQVRLGSLVGALRRVLAGVAALAGGGNHAAVDVLLLSPGSARLGARLLLKNLLHDEVFCRSGSNFGFNSRFCSDAA